VGHARVESRKLRVEGKSAGVGGDAEVVDLLEELA